MKKVFQLVPVVVALFVATTAFGQITPGTPSSYPSVTVANTPHNLNNYPGVSIPGDQICLPCHTPHNALLAGNENVLWNHEETGENFTMYSDAAGQPEGRSKMCLSCHDGVTAIDSYGGTTGSTKITGTANLGTNLSDDHPIGVEYPDFATTDYNDPSGFDGGINSGDGVKLVTFGSGATAVQRVECTSCHNVHNNGLGSFLRVPLQTSYICLQCHDK